MKQGHLSSFFKGIAIKQLSTVEVNPAISNQHEFNGTNHLRSLLGEDRKEFPAKFIYLGNDENDTVTDDCVVTWYDARESHPSRTEYRLYYSTNLVSELLAEKDILIIGKTPDDSLIFIVIQSGSLLERKILWLFDIPDGFVNPGFQIRDVQGNNDPILNYASNTILYELGIEISETDDDYLDIMLDKFQGKFPKTQDFSKFARSTIPHVNSVENPDDALLLWMEQEELLFRTMERYFVSKQLETPFPNVDSFIKYSLSIQNRRKSRTGFALENHLNYLFTENRLQFSWNKETENKSKPDFIFPGINEYKNLLFPKEKLVMLGVKSTCKDRWRQVLSEASRIAEKHLLTLEPGISKNQTDEMKANNLHLVIPQSLHGSFQSSQISWLMNLKTFIELVRNRQ